MVSSLPVAPYVNQNLIENELNRKKQMIGIVVLILNFLFPFSLGTFVFLCAYPNKEKNDTIHAFCLIGFTILAYVMLFVSIA